MLDRKQLDAAGPVAGGAQMLQATPGTNVVGYGETGGTKYTVILNGIQQGWAGEATSFTAPGSLGITYDGIPVADPATGLWQSATMPQNLVIQDVQVTYGPGAGGGPLVHRRGRPRGVHADSAHRGPPSERRRHGWPVWHSRILHSSAIPAASKDGPRWLGGGLGRGDDFRLAPDGFGNPTKNGSVFGKTVKTFSAGSLAFGVLYAKGGGYRPTVIPTTDVGLVEPSSGMHFSQATSGFYSALPYADYNKYDTNEGVHGLCASETVSEPYVHAREFGLVHAHSPFSPAQRRRSRRGRPGGRVEQSAQQHVWRPDRVFPGFPLQHGQLRRLPAFTRFITRTTFSTIPPMEAAAPSRSSASGSKFRSGYFQQDNVTFFAQDDIHPIPQIHIIPSVRVDGFSTSYSDQAQRDFTFAPGTYFSRLVARSRDSVLSIRPTARCTQTGQRCTDPYHNVFGDPVHLDGTQQRTRALSAERMRAARQLSPASTLP